MYPILVHWGSFVLPSWHVLFVIAALCGWWLLTRWRVLVWPESHPKQIDSLFLMSYASGYLGARGLSIILESDQLTLSQAVVQLFAIGSMTLYGGILAAAAIAILYAKSVKLSLLRLADLALPATLMGIAIGRIGCFLNGDDFGVALADQLHPGMLAVQFPNLEDGLYRYPVQIWETLSCLLLFSISWSKRSWAQSHVGRIGSLGILGYACCRFILEFYRGDDRGHFLSDIFSPAQTISVLIVIVWLLVLWRKNFARGKV